MGRVFIGISGYDYPGWRGRFYPPDLPRRRWLAYAGARFNSIELNGTFYSLKSPDVFRRWVEEAPARGHDTRLKRGALVGAAARVRYRHAFEVRHPSYFVPEFFDLLRAHRVGYVIADTAGKWTLAEEVTAGFVYVRLHGSRVLYGSDYTDEELAAWAARVRAWSSSGRDVYVYFDNDRHAYAPHDALELARQVRDGAP